jgi:hypothetical protein
LTKSRLSPTSLRRRYSGFIGFIWGKTINLPTGVTAKLD